VIWLEIQKLAAEQRKQKAETAKFQVESVARALQGLPRQPPKLVNFAVPQQSDGILLTNVRQPRAAANRVLALQPSFNLPKR